MLALALASMPASSTQRCAAASGALASVLASGDAQACGRSCAVVESALETTARLSSPPRPGTRAGFLRSTLAPNYVLTASKTRRKRRQSGGVDGDGGDDGGDGGDDGGGGSWYGHWDDDGEEDDDGSSMQIVSGNLAAWRWCLFLLLLQTVHFLVLNASRPISIGSMQLANSRNGRSGVSSQFATLSAAFFARRVGRLQPSAAS